MSDLVVPRLTEAQIGFLSAAIAVEIRKRAREWGVSDSDVEAALSSSDVVLADMDCSLMAVFDGAFVAAEDSPDGRHTVHINLDTERFTPTRLQVLVHEFARYLMRDWAAAALYGADTVICRGQDNDRARYRLASGVHRTF